MDETIFTINARGNILLPVTRDHWRLDGPQMNAEIWGMFRTTRRILEAKHVGYNLLKSALVPSTKKHEAAFLFDTRKIDSMVYGMECMERLLPLLEPDATLSVLVGDLIADDVDTAIWVLQQVAINLEPGNAFDFQAHPGLIFAIYVTNISPSRLAAMHDGLRPFEPYIGYVPCTFRSKLKFYLSGVLANLFVKHKKTIILAHEDDRPNREDMNITLYPLESFGYKVRSLQQAYFGVFLTYKIERPVFPNFVEDTEIALNALSHTVADLDELRVWMSDDKYRYLIEVGKLRRTSLAGLGKSGLETLIWSKIKQSYIYQLRIRPDHGVSTFTVMLEANHDDDGTPFRIEVSLHYDPVGRSLRVVTMM